jgi:penicillin-binding protein-related factor A (putative recombinase)
MASEATFSFQLRKDIKNVFDEDVFVYLIHNMKNTGKKPFDFIFLYKGKMFAIECKFVKGNTFNFDNMVKPHQSPFLQEVKKAGGVGLFVICFMKYNETFILGPHKMDYLSELGKSSKIEHFRGCSGVVLMERKKINGRTRWEVEKLVNNDF